jgi:hypothetical protein
MDNSVTSRAAHLLVMLGESGHGMVRQLQVAQWLAFPINVMQGWRLAAPLPVVANISNHEVDYLSRRH